MNNPQDVAKAAKQLLDKIRVLNMKPGELPPRSAQLDAIEADAADLYAAVASAAAMPEDAPNYLNQPNLGANTKVAPGTYSPTAAEAGGLPGGPVIDKAL